MSNFDPLPCLQKTADGVLISVRVSPHASRSKLLGLYENSLKAAVQSPPIDGAANHELIRLLAKTLGIPKSHFQIIRGETSKIKILKIRPASLQEIHLLLSGKLSKG